MLETVVCDDVIGLGGLSMLVLVQRAAVAAFACVVEIFVAILTHWHRLPTGLLCVIPHLSQSCSMHEFTSCVMQNVFNPMNY